MSVVSDSVQPHRRWPTRLPSLGFSRQEHWSGLPFPSPMHEREKWKWSCLVMSDLRDPMVCSLPGSSIHGIFQARVLEWGAIAFSGSSKLPSSKIIDYVFLAGLMCCSICCKCSLNSPILKVSINTIIIISVLQIRKSPSRPREVKRLDKGI